MKYCRKCKTTKPKDDFWKNKKSKDGLASWCKKCTGECNRKSAKEWLFGGNREKAIQRDGEKCVRCEMTRKEHKKKYGRDITVDHIDGKGCYTKKELKNNNLDNLKTLCLSCHGRKDIKRAKHTVLEEDQVREILKRLQNGEKEHAIARDYPIQPRTVYDIEQGKSWKHLSREETQ